MSFFYVLLTVVFLGFTFPVCLAVYHYFTRISIKDIPRHCSVWHIIALYTCVIAFPLLVIDVNASVSAANPQTWMRPIWMIIFVMSYFCAWISLPIAQMYTEVGDFTWKKALIHSVKLNLKLYAVVVSLILIVLAYLVFLKGAYTSIASTGKVIISLANSWGLLMLILFMPAGLVGIPRSLWRNADPSRALVRHLFDAVDIQEELEMASLELTRLKRELIHIEPLISDDLRPHLAAMQETITVTEQTIHLRRRAGGSGTVASPTASATADVTLEHLVDLNARLKAATKVATRIHYQWSSLAARCDELDRILRGTAGTEPDCPSWKRTWYQHRHTTLRVGCVATTALTVLILWSELTLPFRSLSSVPLGLIEIFMSVRMLQFITSVIFLFYMGYCSYWAAFQFKVFNVYVILPAVADNASLCFNEVFLVRLLMPLCFNFLLMAGLATSNEDVQYGHVYRRNMDVSLLFGSFVNRFLPVLIPVVAAVVFFKLTARVMATLGIEFYNPDDLEKPSVQSRIDLGRRLVEEELKHPLVAVTNGVDCTAPIVMDVVVGSGEEGTSSPKRDRGARYSEYLAKRNGTLESREGDDE